MKGHFKPNICEGISTNKNI